MFCFGVLFGCFRFGCLFSLFFRVLSRGLGGRQARLSETQNDLQTRISRTPPAFSRPNPPFSTGKRRLSTQNPSFSMENPRFYIEKPSGFIFSSKNPLIFSSGKSIVFSSGKSRRIFRQLQILRNLPLRSGSLRSLGVA